MSSPSEVSLRGLNQCGCCAGLTAETPADVLNRPGLAAIAYRVGTYANFRESLLARLSESRFSVLRQLRSRDNDDFTIALLDAWAVTSDVLTFYQERIANESYLRTATERLSILELARLIGYELHPGVAASTYLAFTLEDAPGAPDRTTIDIGTRVQSIPGPEEKPQTFETVEKIEAHIEWNALKPQMTQAPFSEPTANDLHVYLEGVATNLRRGDAILFVDEERRNNTSSDRWDFRRLTKVVADPEGNRTRIEWAEALATAWGPDANPEIHAFRLRAELFGARAPHPKTLADQTLKHYGFVDTPPGDWKFEFTPPEAPNTIDLDAIYPAIVAGSWLVLSQPNSRELYGASTVVEASRADFTLTAKTTRITVEGENLKSFEESYRDTVVFAQSELLETAEGPITTDISGAKIDLAAVPRGITKGKRLVASGKKQAGEPVSELVSVSETSGAKLTVSPPLTQSYKRETFSFNANVAAATHGESVQEVLGSGDATQSYQSFRVKQPPLTQVSAATVSGAESTLQVRVNDLRWQEVPTLYGREAQEHVYVTRTDDEGKTTVQFGDGITGARLPSGQNNVHAVYRKGLGLNGLVKARQLSMLLSRPLGVRAVNNPLDATGAQDPQRLEDARQNGPLTVRTLDRIVSLPDYEDFARSFAGIAKALATWTWDGREHAVFVTVAGPGGAAIPSDSATYKHLLAAMQKAGDPFVRLSLESYRPAEFRLAVKIKVASDFDDDKVRSSVERALRSEFSFDRRAFGQPVMLSEVIAVIHSAPGVVAADVDKFYRKNESHVKVPRKAVQQPLLKERLLAELPVTSPGEEVLPAELLTLDDGPLDNLGVMK